VRAGRAAAVGRGALRRRRRDGRLEAGGGRERARAPALLRGDAPPRAPPRAASRLDREASGAVLLTKTLAAQRDVERQLDDGTAELELLAFVEGHPHDGVDQGRLPLGADPPRAECKSA